MKYPTSLEQLIKSFMKYPGIGPKTAERLALFTIEKMSSSDVSHFADALVGVKNNLKICKKCGFYTDEDVCKICADQSRARKLLVVENSKQVVTIDEMGVYDGYYFVLKGTLSPMEGIGPKEIHLDVLQERVKELGVQEIIIAISSNISGELTAHYISELYKNTPVACYRIGFGLPFGANIEYVDAVTLKKALEQRTRIEP